MIEQQSCIVRSLSAILFRFDIRDSAPAICYVGFALAKYYLTCSGPDWYGVPGIRNWQLFFLYGYSYHDVTLLNSFQHIHSLN